MAFPLILNSLAATGFLAGVESCRGRKNGQFTENTAATGSNGPLQSCRSKIGQGTKLARALKALGRPQNAPYAEQVPSVANVFLSPSEQKDRRDKKDRETGKTRRKTERRHRAFLGFLGQDPYICVTFDIFLLARKSPWTNPIQVKRSRSWKESLASAQANQPVRQQTKPPRPLRPLLPPLPRFPSKESP